MKSDKSTLKLTYGDIAQLARAPALQAGGQGFDSLYLHHKHHTNYNRIIKYADV